MNGACKKIAPKMATADTSLLSLLGQPVLYAGRLATDLGIEPSNALRQRLHTTGSTLASVPASALGSSFATLATAPPGGAPSGPGSSTSAADGFIGRRTELAELDALLALPELRLLTLLGPGGVGKSRLARQALARCGRHFPAGAWWVDLQDLQDLPALTARLAQQLGIEINDTRDVLATVCSTTSAADGWIWQIESITGEGGMPGLRFLLSC